jgi:hypothetical protein
MELGLKIFLITLEVEIPKLYFGFLTAIGGFTS